MSSSSPPPPRERLTLATPAMLLRAVVEATLRHHAGLDGPRKTDAVEGMTALFTGKVHLATREFFYGLTLCNLCATGPMSREYVYIEHDWYPNIQPTFDTKPLRRSDYPSAICRPCASRSWSTWEADVAAIIDRLQQGGPVAKDAAADLEERFRERQVSVIEAPAECDYCHRWSHGVKGSIAFICTRCMAEVEAVFERGTPAEAEKVRRREEERNSPFPDDMLADAKRMAVHLRARRERVLGPPPAPRSREPDDARWDEMRGWFAESSSYSSMNKYHERIRGLTPPTDLVDLVCTGLARILASEALNGYRQRDRAQFTDDVSVVSDRWVAQEVGSFLWRGEMSPAVREQLDTALVLLRHALLEGACYLERDEQIYEDITRFYVDLVKHLYDYRRPQVEALREGAILLHGGSAEDREEAAREIHLARTGGLDEVMGIPWVIIGRGRGQSPLFDVNREATVYIPDPLALSTEEQQQLALRLDPDGPPGPTLLGADDEASFREQAQSRMLGELVPRLYTFEHDLRLELSTTR